MYFDFQNLLGEEKQVEMKEKNLDIQATWAMDIITLILLNLNTITSY